MARLTLVVSAMLSPIIAPPPARADTALLSSEPYKFSYDTLQAWLAFVRTTEDGANAAAAYQKLFSADDYQRSRSGARTTIRRFVYSSDGLKVRGILIEPKGAGPYPVVIYNHGGVMQWGRIVLGDVLELNRLAERGYVVIASTFRGEGGSEGQPNMDGGDVTDTLRLIDVAKTLPKADTTRIGMWGFSRGGGVTYAALRRTQAIKAAVIIGGPTDLAGAPRRAEFDQYVYPYVMPTYNADKEGTLARLSPIQWPTELADATPILLLNGGADANVPPSDALRMAEALQVAGRSYRLKIYEGGSHSLLENFSDVRAEMDRWFDRYLCDGAAPPRNVVNKRLDAAD